MTKTLILDLDETLLHSWDNPSFLSDIYANSEMLEKLYPVDDISRIYNIQLKTTQSKSYIWGTLRPGLYEFLQFASNYFNNIIIWSAGVDEYVHKIVDVIFLNAGVKKPGVIFTRDHCASYTIHNDRIYHKPISFVSNYLNQKHYSSMQFDIKMTLILDDKLHTFKENKLNGVLIPQYIPNVTKTKFDDLINENDFALDKFKKWLNTPEVLTSKDYTKLDKSKIFY